MYNSITASKLYTYFTARMGMVEYHRGWLQGDCPQCGKYLKYGIHIPHNRGNCFSCGYTTKPLWVVADIEGLKTYSEIMQFLSNIDGSTEFKMETPVEYIDNTQNFLLPKEFILIGTSDSIANTLVENNLTKRGFKIRSLQRAGVGYCSSGPYKGRIIFPYYIGGKMVYFNARKFIDLGAKFKNPSEEEAGIGKSRLIYNYDNLFIYNKVWLTESVTNSITIGERGTGTGGKSLSSWQINQYIKCPAKKIIIGLDPDALKESAKIGMALAPFKKIKVLKFPEGEDINSIGKKASLEIEKETPYMNYKDCYKIYLNA